MSNKRDAPPECGTSAGYWWHRRVDGLTHATVDEACRKAVLARTRRAKRIRMSAISQLIGRHRREFDQIMAETRARFDLADARKAAR